MLGGQRHVHRIIEQVDPLHRFPGNRLRRLTGEDVQREVELTAAQTRDRLLGLHHLDDEPDVGMQRTELGDRERHDARRCR